MDFIDTHAHLYASAFEGDRTEMLNRAFAQGVNEILLPNIDAESLEGMFALEAAYPGRCHALMGLHPCHVEADYQAQLAWVEQWLSQRPFKAIGEIGLDYYWSKDFVAEQQAAFRQQCLWALDYNLPIVIHGRDSLDDLLSIVAEYPGLRGVFHCFTGTVEQGQRAIELGFYLGIGGVLTYKKAGLDAVCAQLPLERLVLETDAPYLPPTPHRGKRNESSYIPLIAARLAEVQGLSLAEVAAQTTANARDLFGL